MASTVPRAAMFDIAGDITPPSNQSSAGSSPKATQAPKKARKATGPRKRRSGCYQMNCTIDIRLRKPLGQASLDSDKSIGEVVEKILVDHFEQTGLLTKEQAAEIKENK